MFKLIIEIHICQKVINTMQIPLDMNPLCRYECILVHFMIIYKLDGAPHVRKHRYLTSCGVYCVRNQAPELMCIKQDFVKEW